MISSVLSIIAVVPGLDITRPTPVCSPTTILLKLKSVRGKALLFPQNLILSHRLEKLRRRTCLVVVSWQRSRSIRCLRSFLSSSAFKSHSWFGRFHADGDYINTHGYLRRLEQHGHHRLRRCDRFPQVNKHGRSILVLIEINCVTTLLMGSKSLLFSLWTHSSVFISLSLSFFFCKRKTTRVYSAFRFLFSF